MFRLCSQIFFQTGKKLSGLSSTIQKILKKVFEIRKNSSYLDAKNNSKKILTNSKRRSILWITKS